MNRIVNINIEEMEIILDLLSDRIKRAHIKHKYVFKRIQDKLRPLYLDEIDIRLHILGLEGIDYDDYIT